MYIGETTNKGLGWLKEKLKKRDKCYRTGGPTGSRTQVAGFKVQSANHFTMEPLR